jgi:hypothetical protein
MSKIVSRTRLLLMLTGATAAAACIVLGPTALAQVPVLGLIDGSQIVAPVVNAVGTVVGIVNDTL